jgi:hypothetical protein
MKIRLSNILILMLFCTFTIMADVYTTPDGHQFEVNLIPDKPEIMIGEPLFLSFEVKNLSNVDLAFSDGGDYRNRLGRPLSYDIKAIGDDGREVPVPEIKYNMGGMIGLRKIEKNGGTYAVRLFLPLWSPFEEAGDYNIICNKSLKIRYFEKDSPRIDYFSIKGVPVSVKTKINVVSNNESKMSKIIDFWGEEITNSKSFERSYEAIRALEYIGDKRIIKPLIKAVRGEKEFSTIDSAIRLLGKFDEDEAFTTIVSQMNHKTNSVRIAVVEALSFSKNRKAFANLLKLKDDDDKFVRLAVLQSLGRSGTPMTIKIMKEMLNGRKKQRTF